MNVEIHDIKREDRRLLTIALLAVAVVVAALLIV